MTQLADAGPVSAGTQQLGVRTGESPSLISFQLPKNPRSISHLFHPSPQLWDVGGGGGVGRVVPQQVCSRIFFTFGC